MGLHSQDCTVNLVRGGGGGTRLDSLPTAVSLHTLEEKSVADEKTPGSQTSLYPGVAARSAEGRARVARTKAKSFPPALHSGHLPPQSQAPRRQLPRPVPLLRRLLATFLDNLGSTSNGGKSRQCCSSPFEGKVGWGSTLQYHALLPHPPSSIDLRHSQFSILHSQFSRLASFPNRILELFLLELPRNACIFCGYLLPEAYFLMRSDFAQRVYPVMIKGWNSKTACSAANGPNSSPPKPSSNDCSAAKAFHRGAAAPT